MTEKQWKECLGEFVRDYIRSPELERYFGPRSWCSNRAISYATG